MYTYMRTCTHTVEFVRTLVRLLKIGPFKKNRLQGIEDWDVKTISF